MATPYDPWYKAEGLKDINGPASINATLLDAVTTANFEGVWVPWQFVKQGSLEVSGTFATLSLTLVGTNAQAPLNSYVVTIGGSGSAGDTVNLNFATPFNTLTASIVATAAQTATSMAAALVAAISTSNLFQAMGFLASNLAGVITVTWPTQFPLQVPGTYTTSQPPVSPIVIFSSSVTGAATETVAVAPGTGGSNLGSAITAAGMTQFTVSTRWLKLRVTTLTGGNVTGIAQGTA